MTDRRKMPRSRVSKTTDFQIGEMKGYLIVGLFEDGTPGEVFLKAAKTGSTLQGALDSLAIMVSHGLQYGMPLSKVVGALAHMRYEPSGQTNDKDIPKVSSVSDYLARKLAFDYMTPEEAHEALAYTNPIQDLPKEHTTHVDQARPHPAAPAEPGDKRQDHRRLDQPSGVSGDDLAGHDASVRPG